MVRRLALLIAAAVAAAAVLFWATLPDVTPLAATWPRTTAFMERRKAKLLREGKNKMPAVGATWDQETMDAATAYMKGRFGGG